MIRKPVLVHALKVIIINSLQKRSSQIIFKKKSTYILKSISIVCSALAISSVLGYFSLSEIFHQPFISGKMDVLRLFMVIFSCLGSFEAFLSGDPSPMGLLHCNDKRLS